jgi:hypothetical protein
MRGVGRRASEAGKPKALFRCSALGVLLLALLAGCRQSKEPDPGEAPLFTSVVAASGIGFVHDNGFDGRRYRVVETVNGGVALIDHDGDGWLDIYFTSARTIDAAGDGPRNALYRNNGDGTFSDVSRRAGVDDPAFSLGCAVADYDGDGHPDLLVTNDGPCRLYRNNGDGTFTDLALRAGIAAAGMHSGAAFLDMDGDGDLDLYIAQYVVDAGDDGEHPPCKVRGVPGYCPPASYQPAPDRLFENLGDGRFADVSESSGIQSVRGRSLGVLAADLDGDGDQDIFVANDMMANFLFLGDGKGRFVEAALLHGVAYGDDGAELGSMGVDVADYDADGRLDLCITNYQGQINNLFRAMEGGYDEMARLAGIAPAAVLPDVAWGVGFVDVDNDGWKDLFIANGHLNPYTRDVDEGTSFPQPNRLWRNLGNGRFAEVAGRSAEALRKAGVSRGAAFGDIDNDGDIDIVVLEAGARPELLRNDAARRNAWCLIRLLGSGLNRDGIGAKVTVEAAGRRQMLVRQSSGSYLSASDPRLHFGLGSAGRIDRLEVRWPDGQMDVHADLPVRRLLEVTAGAKEVKVVELTPAGR